MLNALQLNEITEIEEMSEENKQRFEVKDIHSLSWVLRKLAVLEAKKVEVNRIAEIELERIEHFRKKELESIQDNENFFRGLISEYAIRKRYEDPKFKIKTPYGSVGFKKQQPKWNYDDKALIAYLNENELYDFVRVKQEPNKVEIKKQFNCTEDGRVYDPNGVEVQGIKVESKPDELVIKLEV